MYYILERGGEKIMKKRWFVVILTIGLLLHVLPLSVLALSPDPTITDSDGTILHRSESLSLRRKFPEIMKKFRHKKNSREIPGV